MKRFSKNDNSAICNYCGKWQPTDLTNQQLEEMDWKCDECKAKEVKPQEAAPPAERGSKEISKYDPEYEFLVKLIQLVTKEGVPPQEVKALAESHPFVTVDDVGDLAAQIWTLATQKYQIPSEWLTKKLPKNASLNKKADSGIATDLTQFALDDKEIRQHFQNRGTTVEDVIASLPNFAIKYIPKEFEQRDSTLRDHTKGFYDFKTGTLYINPRLPLDSKRLTIIHEIEHAIQDSAGVLPVHTDEEIHQVRQTPYQDRSFEWGARQQQFNALKARNLSLEEIENILVERAAGLIKPTEFDKETVREAIHNEVEQMEEIYNEMMPESIMASKKKADMWRGQEEADDMINHAPGYLAYSYGQDKEADGEFTGAEFSGTDAGPNPLTDIGPWSSPEDHGKKPQKSPFPNTNWLPADDQNLDQQAPSNVAASLKKEALAQQDVVDFYLMSLIPAEYLASEVTPDHYDGLTIFKGVIESLRNEYIERGMVELVDEAETTAWTKAIKEEDMPEQIKQYYTFHDSPFPGRGYNGNSDGEDFDDDSYTCASCGGKVHNDDIYFFHDEVYCESCAGEALEMALRENVTYCVTHNVFTTDDSELRENFLASMGYKVSPEDEHPEDGQHEIVRYKDGEAIWDEVTANAKKQLQLQFEERKKRREQNPEQLKLPQTNPTEETASLKQAGEGRYTGNDNDGWWEAPTNFNDYTAQDFYTIFKYAPWKHLYGGPLWAEVARTVYEMQKTTQWDKLVVLIDHFHDLGHNTGKLLDKFPEWHQWFKKLLDMKAQKNSIRYLLPKASRPVQDLVTEYLRVHGKTWREDEEKKEPKINGGWEIGDKAIIPNPNNKDLKLPIYDHVEIVSLGDGNQFAVRYDNGSTDWVDSNLLQSPSVSASSLNRPFSKKAGTSRYWIAPDGTEFDAGTHHGVWVNQHPKELKQYGIKNVSNLADAYAQMYASGWTRVTPERGFTVQVGDLRHIPSYLDNFIAENFKQGDSIRIGTDAEMVEINNPFPSIQKAVNKQLMHSKASLKQADISGQVTNKILQNIHENGGTTFNLSSGDMSGTPNYSVSIYPDRERVVEGVDFDSIEGFIADNEDLLKDPSNSFGAWTDAGKVYLDVVVTIPDRAKAIELAKQHNQIAIWDLQNSKEILTGGTGGSGVRAFSKKNLVKVAAEQLLTEVDQNAIAAASSPAYVIAVNNYAEAFKRGHSKDRALEYALESVSNVEKLDPKKLVEFINKYIPN